MDRQNRISETRYLFAIDFAHPTRVKAPELRGRTRFRWPFLREPAGDEVVVGAGGEFGVFDADAG